MSLAFHARLQANATELQTAMPVLDQLAPQDWPGLAPTAPTGPSVEADVREFTPQFAIPRQIAGRRGIKAPVQALLVPVAGSPGQFEVQPILTVWPYTIPTVGKTSLLDSPVLTAPAGSYIFLRVNWSISAGYRLSSRDASLLASTRELHLTNDAGGIQSPPVGTVSKTWHHLIGSISAAGELVPYGYASPFIPEQLTP